MREEEKKRLKMVSALANKCAGIQGLLSSFSECVGVSLVTKYFNEMNQIVGKEHILDNDVLDVIVDTLQNYQKSMMDKVNELNKCM